MPRQRLLLSFALAAAGLAAWWWIAGRNASPAGDAAARLLRPLAHRHGAAPPRPTSTQPWPPRAADVQGVTDAERALMAGIERMLRDALAADPADVGAVLDAARRLLWFGNWPQAEVLADGVLASLPGDLEALAVRSAVRFEQGRRDEGIELALQVLRHRADEPLALAGRAEQLAAAGHLEPALADLRRAAEVDPFNPRVPFLAGSLLAASGRYQDSAPWLERALTWVPEPGIGKGPFLTGNLATVALLAGKEALRVSGADTVELPLGRLPLPAVRGTLRGNGRELAGWLVLDSGASHTVLGNDAAALARESGSGVAMATVAGAQAVGFGLLARLELAGLCIDDVPVLVPRSPHVPHAEGVIATLGVQVMRRFLTTFDLSTGTFRLAPGGSGATAPAQATIPFQLVDNQIHVPARFAGGKERTFLFDSGASAVFVSTKVLVEEFGQLAGRAGSQVSFAGEESLTIEVEPPRALEFGGRKLPVRSVFGDPTMERRNQVARRQVAGTMGLVVKARYVLDFERHELRMSQ